MKKHEHEIVDNTANGKVLGRAWWTGRTIATSNHVVDGILDDLVVYNKTRKDGEVFIEHLPRGFRNGYLVARRVRKDDE